MSTVESYKGDVVKVITVRQPFASAIVRGLKRVENRSWEISYRGMLAIHAGLAHDASFYKAREYLQMSARARDEFSRELLDRGAIVGVCELVDIKRNSSQRWARDGQFHWILANACELPRAIVCKGALGLRELDAHLLRAINKQLATVNYKCGKMAQEKE